MTRDEQISHMAQELSNVAFVRYFAGPMKVEVVGRLERFVRNHFCGGHLRRQTDSVAAAQLEKTFALDFLLRGFQRWLVGPAFVLVSGEETGAQEVQTNRCSPRAVRNPAMVSNKPAKPSGARMCEAWERRLLAAMIDAFVAECDEVCRVEAVPSPTVTTACVELFRKRWEQFGGSVSAGLRKPGADTRYHSEVEGCFGLSRRLREQADRLLGQMRKPTDPDAEITEGRRALACFGSSGSIPLRRALKWHSDRKRFLAAFWAPGQAVHIDAALEPWELYAAWIELRINEATSCMRRADSCEILGRLRGDPPNQFYNWAGDPRSIQAYVDGPFAPNARLVLVREEGRRIRRVWVQAEWERPREIHERQAFLAWQAINLGCEELVVVTPLLDERCAMGTEGTGDFVSADVRLPIRVLQFIPDPAAKDANETSIRALLQAEGEP
jgi:hypothetical protein